MEMYRLVFKNGRHGAWSLNKDRVERDAKLFNATVETKCLD